MLTGLALGWVAHERWGSELDPNPDQPVIPLATLPSQLLSFKTTAAELPAESRPDNSMAALLDRGAYQSAVERYENLQDQSDELALEHARAEILVHARLLVSQQQFESAGSLLQAFLNTAYHDVEARLLLAEVHYGLDDSPGAIDQLYEARGYAYQPEVLNRISKRIRVVVNQLAGLLRQRGDHKGLLDLYQRLTLMEPDHADYFIGLATAQLALDYREAAQRSLTLVSHDPVVGPQAQKLLAQLVPGDSGLHDKQSVALSSEVAGIPLHQRGNSFLVDAGLANAGSVRLLIDTGASITILAPEVLKRRGIRYRDTGSSRIFNTANGRVRAPIYILDVLTVGDWQVEQLEIGVLNLGRGSGKDGLLGMNFLKHFQFFIDQNDALLRLSLN